jgi:hypothetical protein
MPVTQMFTFTGTAVELIAVHSEQPYKLDTFHVRYTSAFDVLYICSLTLKAF